MHSDARSREHHHSRHQNRRAKLPRRYTVNWRGLPIGRIRKNPGLPAHVVQWSWGCNAYGQPSLSGDSGEGTDLEDCKAKFKAAWARVRKRAACGRKRCGSTELDLTYLLALRGFEACCHWMQADVRSAKKTANGHAANIPTTIREIFSEFIICELHVPLIGSCFPCRSTAPP